MPSKHLVTLETVGELIDRITSDPGMPLALDTETTGLSAVDDYIVGIGISCSTRHGVYLPFRHKVEEIVEVNPIYDTCPSCNGSPEDGKCRKCKGEGRVATGEEEVIFDEYDHPDNLPKEVVDTVMKAVLESDRLVVMHNAAFDLMMLRKEGWEITNKVADTMIARWLLYRGDMPRGRGMMGLKRLAKSELGHTMIEYSEVDTEGRGFQYADLEQGAEYGADDPKRTLQLWRRYEAKLEEMDSIYGGFTYEFEALEMPIVRVISHMQETGMYLKVDHLKQCHNQLVSEMEEIQKKLNDIIGGEFPITSTKKVSRMMFDDLKWWDPRGLERGKPVGKQIVGCFSTNETVLRKQATAGTTRGRTVALLMLRWRKLESLRARYCMSLVEKVDSDGRIRAGFHQAGTETGRFSCVSGDTIIRTNRGVHKIASYKPLKGDCVVTHTGRFMPVLRKVYKGEDRMYRVTLANGCTLECTLDHRFLTPRGEFVRLRDLELGEELSTYVGIPEFRPGPPQHPSSAGRVPGPGAAHTGGDRVSLLHYDAERERYPEGKSLFRKAEGREGFEVLPVEDGWAKSYEGEDGRYASQPHRGHRQWRWVFDAKGRWEVCEGPSHRDGRSVGSGTATGLGDSTPHRREQEEQLPGQPRAGDRAWASSATCERSRIEAIDPMGTMGVWDLTVEGDHSYAAHGFLNHNSSGPNLQNIPRNADNTHPDMWVRHLPAIRGAFVSPPGRKLIDIDYSQIELRLMAHMSHDKTMCEIYNVDGDIHQRTADEVGVKRQDAKAINFGLIYGMSAWRLGQELGVPEEVAEKYITRYFNTYPAVRRYHKYVERMLQKRWYVTTITGRHRKFQEVNPKINYRKYGHALRAAINTTIQGSAADLIKIAMRNCYERFVEEGALGTKVWLVSTVHDEVIAEALDDYAEEAAVIMKHEFENAVALRVPLRADPQIGTCWGDIH